VAEVVELKALIATQRRNKYKKYIHSLKNLCLNPVVTSGKKRGNRNLFARKIASRSWINKTALLFFVYHLKETQEKEDAVFLNAK
jgi:hypothetical protein